MWVLKVSLRDENGLFSWRNKKFAVETYSYRTGYYVDGDEVHMNGVMLLAGIEDNKKRFVESLKKDSFVRNLEVNGDLLTCRVVKPKSISSDRDESVFYSMDLVHLKPVYTDKEGVECWEVCSWNRNNLEKILSAVKKHYKGKLLYLKKMKLSESDFLFFSLYPELTGKQKQAFLLALKEGYYEFPRRTELKELARITGISYTAYQFHLRNAEKKIMHSVGSKI